MSNQFVSFSKFVSEGSHYEIGTKLAHTVRNNPELMSINIQGDCMDSFLLRKKQTLLDEFCPGVNEEILGLSDSLKIPLGKLAVFADDVIEAGACSQFAALPSITSDGHTLIGRSYEFSTEDEMCLCVTRADGKPAHIGFSLLLFGRFDGINEHGLTVSMSSCEFGQRPFGEGLWFPFVLRSLLDNCSSVEDAIYLLKNMPIRSNVNLLIADTYGNATIAETACFGDDRKISFRNSEDLLIATNHYQNNEMLPYDNNRRRHSVIRYNTIKDFFSKKKGSISVESIKTILEEKVPQGVCCPFYEDCLGTLHSMVFDTTEISVQVCFGAASPQKWEKISFNSPCENSKIQVPINNEFPQNPTTFWEHLNPGSMEQNRLHR
ncbi:C45 family peptidase [Paenibacillus sp. FSL H7-0357]|uniref:C45 family autoproteolytic acyltransferase/hydolase n=1 Tax=unclassified Paenibacillus TaxID=185978 RepID=UPI00068AFF6F|nr:C45 family peptidase [Paenibacillus sp. FSL H7-0357]